MTLLSKFNKRRRETGGDDVTHKYVHVSCELNRRDLKKQTIHIRYLKRGTRLKAFMLYRKRVN